MYLSDQSWLPSWYKLYLIKISNSNSVELFNLSHYFTTTHSNVHHQKGGDRPSHHITWLLSLTWQFRTPASSLITVEILLPSVRSHSFIHPFYTLTASPEPLSSWVVICDLPVCGCNKVAMQLRIHFQGTNTTNHRLESHTQHERTHTNATIQSTCQRWSKLKGTKTATSYVAR